MTVNPRTEDGSTMDAVLDTVLSRTSALELSGPEPDCGMIQRLIAAADRAPDHGSLRPWRITVVLGDERRVLGDLIAEAARRRSPGLGDDALERERRKALRAPLVMIVAAKIEEGIKVPEIEQVMATAAAVQNMWIVAHAMGLGAMWKTGHLTTDSQFKAAIGLAPGDHIVAFLYVGHPVRTRGIPHRSTEPLVSTLGNVVQQRSEYENERCKDPV